MRAPGARTSPQAARDDIRTELGPGVRRLRAHRPRPAPGGPQAHASTAWDDDAERRPSRSGRACARSSRRAPAVRRRRRPDAGGRQPTFASERRPSTRRARSPSRATVSVIVSPGWWLRIATISADPVGDLLAVDRDHDVALLAGRPRSAGVPRRARRRPRRRSLLRPVFTLAPITGYFASPVARICSAVTRTCSIGIAKPTPMLPPSPPNAPPVGGDRGVHADHLAAQVDQRAAGVAGVDRGVGLHAR